MRAPTSSRPEPDGWIRCRYRLHSEGIAPVTYDKNSYDGGPYRIASALTTASCLRSDRIFLHERSRIQNLFADSVDQITRPCR